MSINSLEIIAHTITPIIMISAVGLIVLMMQNRYGRLKDRTLRLIRYRNLLLREKRILEDEQKAISILIQRYFKETKMVKNAMLCSFMSIGFVVITCFLILIQEIGSIDLSLLLLGFFTLALLFLLVTIILMSTSLAMSTSTVKYELEQVNLLPLIKESALI